MLIYGYQNDTEGRCTIPKMSLLIGNLLEERSASNLPKITILVFDCTYTLTYTTVYRKKCDYVLQSNLAIAR